MIPRPADCSSRRGQGPRVGDRQMFVNDIPFGFDVSENEIDMVGDATITDALRYPGSRLPRASVLATIADCMAGIPACLDDHAPAGGDPRHRVRNVADALRRLISRSPARS